MNTPESSSAEPVERKRPRWKFNPIWIVLAFDVLILMMILWHMVTNRYEAVIASATFGILLCLLNSFPLFVYAIYTIAKKNLFKFILAILHFIALVIIFFLLSAGTLSRLSSLEIQNGYARSTGIVIAQTSNPVLDTVAPSP